MSWLRRALSEAKGKAEDVGALSVLELVEDHAETFEPLLTAGMRDVTKSMITGDRDRARMIYLARSASFDELMAASTASTEAVQEATQARAAAWGKFWDDAAEIGEAAVKIALPLLLAAL